MPRIEVYIDDRIYIELVKIRDNRGQKGFTKVVNTLLNGALFNASKQEDSILILNKVIQDLNLKLQNKEFELRLLREKTPPAPKKEKKTKKEKNNSTYKEVVTIENKNN